MNLRPLLLTTAMLLSPYLLPVAGDEATPPPAVSVLMQKLTAACRACDLEVVKACYDTDGASTEEIDIALSSWQEDFNQSSNKTDWKFDKISYQTLAQVAHENPNFTAGMDGRHKMGEHFYEPNLHSVGFVTSIFRSVPPNGSSAGTTESVGLMQDGSARLILMRLAK